MPYCFVKEDKSTETHSYKFEIVRNGFDAVKECNTFVKGMIPANERSYNQDAKTWEVDSKYWPAIEIVFKNKGFQIKYEVLIQNEHEYRKNFFHEQSPTTSTPAETKDTLRARLASILGISISDISGLDVDVKRLYRKKALELHPDRNNGDGSRMSELNSTWTAYQNAS